MRYSRTTLLFVVLAGLTIFGCGGGSSSEPLDEVGQRYTASIAILDLDDATLTIDAFRSTCDGEPEDYGPVTAAVTFSVNDTEALGITLTNYVIEYIPLPSEDGVGGIVMPPTLDGPLVGGNLGIDILPGETVEFEITCMSVDTKEEYRTKLGWILCPDDPSGNCQLLLNDIDADIIAKEASIATTQANLAAAVAAGDADQVALYTTLLETQNNELDQLEAEYWDQYYSYALPYPDLDESRYKIKITFHFEDAAEEDRTIKREATVWLGNYDRC